MLQKSFWGDERKFSGTLTRVARGDVRDHVVPRKNDHGPAERRDGASQCYSSLKITFREIFGVVRFSTFATKSARTRLMHRSNDEAMSSFRQAAAYKARVVISSRSFGPEPRERAPERRLPCRGFKQGQLLCLAMSADRLSDRFRQSSQISISVPSSTTCLAGTPKKVAEPLALCCRNAKRVSRQTAMPTTSSLGMIFSRPT
jgi:hypothetical protein